MSVRTTTNLLPQADPEAASAISSAQESANEQKSDRENGASDDSHGGNGAQDILGSDEADPVLAAKMHLVNNAIDEIGWTNYQLKLFFLNGFGYAVDSMLTLIQGIVAEVAFREMGEVGYSAALNIGSYAGLLAGALFWGFGADVIGRKLAFKLSLLLTSIATLLAAAMPNWPSLTFFTAMIGFGCGGNLILDTTVFLEFLPSSKQWTLTALASWWGFGQAMAGLIAWRFMSDPRFNCKEVGCHWSQNMGWRYIHIIAGVIVLILCILRWTVIKLKETPKYLLGIGKDGEVIEALQYIATTYDRSCSLTLEQLDACGVIEAARARTAECKPRFSVGELVGHIRGLFATKPLAWSTSLIWASWTFIGLAYPLLYVFMPAYMASRLPEQVSVFKYWHNYTLRNLSGIPGPLVAGLLCNTRLGRKYTMVIGASLTTIFFFAYIAVYTAAQDLAFQCLIAFFVNIYFGTLYAYTAEVLPSAHRGTGNGISVAFNRLMGMLASVVATSADSSSLAPIIVCGALFAAMAVASCRLPFEPYGRRSS